MLLVTLEKMELLDLPILLLLNSQATRLLPQFTSLLHQPTSKLLYHPRQAIKFRLI